MTLILTEGQKIAKKEIEESLFGIRPRNHVLEGYAGVGKTVLVTHIFKNRQNILFCAPTNKAAKVMREFGISGACTVYQLLCLALEKGKLFQYATPEFDNTEAIVVDECSMISAFIMELLGKYVPKHIPILFVGDPAQLPPVKEKLSKSFLTKNKSTLTEIVRQAEGNPIIKYSMDIRKNGFKLHAIPFDGKNIINVPQSKFFNMALSTYNGGGVTTAWTNKSVNHVNSVLHEMVYGKDVPDYCVGEKIILAEPLLDPFENNAVIATNGDEFIVGAIKPTRYMEYNIWKIETECGQTIYTVQEKDKPKYQNQLNKYFKANLTKEYWKLKERFTDIRLPYAVTCHKLQGSTYNRVIIVGEDIASNWDADSRNKCAYVAVTRAADKIGFLQ